MGILTKDMKRIVREQRLGFVATVCPDGTPNLSPKGTTTVWDDDHLVFADIRSPATIANLRRNPNVEINIVDPFVRKGYRFKGKTAVLSEGPLFEKILAFYEREGQAGDQSVLNRIRSIVLVTVEQALPLLSPVYDAGLTENQVRARWEGHWKKLSRRHRARRRKP
jgi:predicted pyridoxine 5'-phosphate oxidase superfamily flavin-nucleotide-binding protein